MAKDKGNEQSPETPTSHEDDDDDESIVDDDSTEEIIGIPSSLTSAATSKSKSKTINKNKSRQFKQSSQYAAKTTSHETATKRLNSKELFPPSTRGNEEVIVLLKSLLRTNKNLAIDLNQSLREMKQLFVSVDKVDAKLNLIFENQKRIQRTLAKKKINVALHGGDLDTEGQSQIEDPCQPTLNHIKPDGTNIDLLHIYGVRIRIGRFVASVRDHIFKKQELNTITSKQLIKDQRYEKIKEAVRSRFRLNNEYMNLEWPTIHESILQKRRNEIKRKDDNI